MPDAVGFDRRQSPVGVCVEATIEPVVDPDDHHLALAEERELDEAFGRIVDAARGLDRVIERIAEERGDIHRRHGAQKRAVDNRREIDVGGCARAPLRGEDNVENSIATVVLLTDLLDRGFEFRK